ncbi:hypothetical protein GCM10010343_13140 [Streptomyces avidinii]|nr:hypothetical protein GCM10010343_13140 [Streptomyces avidinii]
MPGGPHAVQIGRRVGDDADEPAVGRPGSAHLGEGRAGVGRGERLDGHGGRQPEAGGPARPCGWKVIITVTKRFPIHQEAVGKRLTVRRQPWTPSASG